MFRPPLLGPTGFMADMVEAMDISQRSPGREGAYSAKANWIARRT